MELSYQTNNSLNKTQDETNDLITKRKQTQNLTPRKRLATEKNVDKSLENIAQISLKDQDNTMEDASSDELRVNKAANQVRNSCLFW